MNYYYSHSGGDFNGIDNFAIFVLYCHKQNGISKTIGREITSVKLSLCLIIIIFILVESQIH